MKLRILSDIHIEHNGLEKIPHYEKDNILTIIAGDVGGSFAQTCSYIENNFKNAIVIGGNHATVSIPNKPITKIYKLFKKHFSRNKNIFFLQNNYKIIDDYVFIGATLWFNFSFKTNNEKYDPFLACEKYLKISPTGNGKITKFLLFKRKITPTFFRNECQKTICYINKICKKFNNKKIVIITHHAPTKKAINENFSNWEYISTCGAELENELKKYKNIKCLIHGHTHQTKIYKMNDVPIYCNAFGISTKNENKDFIKNLIIDV